MVFAFIWPVNTISCKLSSVYWWLIVTSELLIIAVKSPSISISFFKYNRKHSIPSIMV